MHIDSLKYFLEVAKSKSITTVAKNSHISQSALSQQLFKLESKLNVKLLNRSNKGVSLTPEGEILFKHSKNILNIYNKMLEEIYTCALEKNYISIEAVDSLNSTILPNAICNLKSTFSQYSINLTSIENSANSNLSNNICDIYITYEKPNSKIGLSIKDLGCDELIVISNHAFSKNKISKSELINLPIILNLKDNYFNNKIQEILLCDIKDLNIVYNTNSYLSLLKGLCCSNSISFIPRTLFNSYKNEFNIKEIAIDDFNLKSNLYLCYLDSFYKNHSDFIKILINMIKGFLE